MKYFFVGIKGSGMSALAVILKNLGHEVVGSDIEQFVFTQTNLEKHNIPVVGFNTEDLSLYDEVIYGNSFDFQFEELAKAKLKNIKCTRYTTALSQLISQYTSVCVAGTHGKTTTTGMMKTMLTGFLRTGYLIGDGDGDIPLDSHYFVVESCEYQDNFLNYFPDYVLINNVELDHVDYFKSLEDYNHSFETFGNQAKKAVIALYEDENIKTMSFSTPLYTFGLDANADLFADECEYSQTGVTCTLHYQGNIYPNIHLPFYGKHMLLNSLAVILVGLIEGYSMMDVITNLCMFAGVNRRFSIDVVNDSVLIDDYAHHPTAISLMIDTCRQKYPSLPVVAIFKPDRYSRLEQFLETFASSLSKADYVYLCDFASNIVCEPNVTVTIDDLKNLIPNSHIIEQDVTGARVLIDLCPATFLFMSSKNIYELKKELVNLLQGHTH